MTISIPHKYLPLLYTFIIAALIACLLWLQILQTITDIDGYTLSLSRVFAASEISEREAALIHHDIQSIPVTDIKSELEDIRIEIDTLP
jgi:hypothetical protein